MRNCAGMTMKAKENFSEIINVKKSANQVKDMYKRIGKILSACLLLLVVTGRITWAAVFTYTDETAYLNDLAAFGYSSFVESFEDDAVWGGLRSTITSKITAPSVTSQGIVWTSNHPATNDITTGNGAAVTGEWGIYDPLHGVATGTPQECDVDNPPEKCLYHDGVSATWAVDGSSLIVESVSA